MRQLLNLIKCKMKMKMQDKMSNMKSIDTEYSYISEGAPGGRPGCGEAAVALGEQAEGVRAAAAAAVVREGEDAAQVRAEAPAGPPRCRWNRKACDGVTCHLCKNSRF